jgi:hypothetical protein
MTEINFCQKCKLYVYGDFCYNCNEIVPEYNDIDDFPELDENESE